MTTSKLRGLKAPAVVLVVVLSGCAAAPMQVEPQEPQPSLGLRIFTGVAEFLVSAAFDAVFSSGEKREKHHEHAKSWAPAPAPAAYTVPAKRSPEGRRHPYRSRSAKGPSDDDTQIRRTLASKARGGAFGGRLLPPRADAQRALRRRDPRRLCRRVCSTPRGAG